MKNHIGGFIDAIQSAITEKHGLLCRDAAIIIDWAIKCPKYVTIRVLDSRATIIEEQRYWKHLNGKIGIVCRVRAGP